MKQTPIHIRMRRNRVDVLVATISMKTGFEEVSINAPKDSVERAACGVALLLASCALIDQPMIKAKLLACLGFYGYNRSEVVKGWSDTNPPPPEELGDADRIR